MVPKKIQRALEIIYSRLKNKKIKWVLAGSSSLALQGVKIRPKDIDIITDKRGALLMNKLLKEYKVKPVKFQRSEFFESYFGEFKIDGVKIEIMGNLKEKRGKKWISLLKRIKSPDFVKIGEIKLPVSPLIDQLRSYEKSGRKKDLIKAKKIREVFKMKPIDKILKN
jgi:hypothetical protein